jgi:L-fucose isomerase-like protein
MSDGISRRSFLEGAAAGTAAMGMVGSLGAAAATPATPGALAKIRIAKVYSGREHPGWPKATVDVKAEQQRFEKEMTRVAASLPDVEFVDCGLLTGGEDPAQLKQKLQGVDGVLVLQLTMGVMRTLQSLLGQNLPVVLFAEPFCGHEWHTIAALQRDGKRIDCWASSKFDDVATAIRPIRAIRRLKDAKILHVSTREADPKYCSMIEKKFGTQIKSLTLKDLQAAYQAVDQAAVEADAQQWIAGAMKVVEPSREDILKGSRMALAIEKMVATEHASAITINCLGMQLMQRGMGYPCLGFARLNSVGLGGICEADLKSSMTHLIFNYLVGRPGFVTDPCFDYSNNTIIHAHCVSSTKMLGPEGPSHPYILRSHLEDNLGVVLQVKLPVGQKVSMARLIDDDVMLFSTGDAIDSPLVDRGCRTKLTVRVPHPERLLEGWSCGLHRVVFYGDHTRDVERFCKMMQIRMVHEGTGEVGDVPNLTWAPHVHA